MSFPNIPNVTPSISITTEQTINLLLASIAFEELGLAHILNAEAEKLQFVLGTLTPTTTTLTPATVSLSDLLAVNTSVQRTLRNVIKKEMLLQFKFENVLDLISTLPTGALTIVKTASAITPEGVLQYAITVTNTGTVPLTNLTVTDTIPPSTTFIAAVPPAGFTATFLAGTVTFTATSPFAPGSTAVLPFTVDTRFVLSGTTLMNTATASANEITPVNSNTTLTIV